MQVQVSSDCDRVFWVLLAGESDAKIYSADATIRELIFVLSLPLPKKNKPRYRANRTVRAAPRAGIFARELAHLVYEARARRWFDDLILVAEFQFARELIDAIDRQTMNHVVLSIHQNWLGLSEYEIRKRLRFELSASAAEESGLFDFGTPVANLPGFTGNMSRTIPFGSGLE